MTARLEENMADAKAVIVERDGKVMVITINRPQARNAVDAACALALAEAFETFEQDNALHVAVLTGAQETFCAGADLHEIASGGRPPVNPQGRAPMGPTWMQLSKPAIAAVEGYAVAGGLELALLCDLRVAAWDAVFGVFNRRWGVPLIDLGTVRLPRLIGLSRALDMILTGRPVDAREALAFGLANRVVEAGRTREEAEGLARSIAAFPPNCVRSDRRSAWEGTDLSLADALVNEFTLGKATHDTGESQAGARRFAEGAGRHGRF